MKTDAVIDSIMDKIDLDLKIGLAHRDLASLRSRVRYALHLALEPEQDTRDDAYERAAARARNNDFEDTNGKDWT